MLEDLDAAGFAGRRSSVNQTEWQACVSWLAAFHAEHLGVSSEGLWESGTYWHIETRPDELDELDDLPLKNAASAIDAKLKETAFQTLVHGDAKLANFCFSSDGSDVAAVDFQYVGGGCGMKDLAYFLGSCFRDEEAESRESEVLNFYFKELRECLNRTENDVCPDEMESDWRPLYRVAWADFHRSSGLPLGSLLGGRGDLNGDMNRILVMGWTQVELLNRLHQISVIAVAITVTISIVSLLYYFASRKRVKSRY